MRNSAILSVKRWFGADDPIGLSSKVEKFSLEGLQLLCEPAPERPEGDEMQGLWSQKNVTERLELFLALCSKPKGSASISLKRYVFNYNAWIRLLEIYDSLPPSAQVGVENCIAPLIRSMSQNKAASMRLIDLVRDSPEGSENLVLKILMIMTELVKPSEKLIEIVRHVVAERKLDMQFIAPILAGFSKEEILVYLPKLFLMLDGTPGRKTVVSDIITRLTAPDILSGKGAIDAVDILVEVNNMDSQITLKKCLEGLARAKLTPE